MFFTIWGIIFSCRKKQITKNDFWVFTERITFLQKVFSFITIIKERYSFRKQPSSWRWVELKSDEHLLQSPTKPIFDAFSLTIWSSESRPGSFIAGAAPSFSIKPCANPASNWAWFIKRSSTNTLEKLRCCPEKQTASRGYLSLTNKNTLFKRHTSWVNLVQRCQIKCIDERTLALALAPVDACTGALFWEKCPYKEFHPSWRHEEPWSENFLKLYEPERNIFIIIIIVKYWIIITNVNANKYCLFTVPLGNVHEGNSFEGK